MEIARNSHSFEIPPTAAVIGRPVDLFVGNKRRVLVFDTEDESCASIAEFLAGQPFDLTYCSEVDEVVSRLRSSEASYDLLLWGLQAPFESGLSALKELRDISSHIRVVLLAPQEALAYAPSIRSVCADSFILKPLRSQDLRLGIEKAIRRPRYADANMAEMKVPQVTVKEVKSAELQQSYSEIAPSEVNGEPRLDMMSEPEVESIREALREAPVDGRDLGLIGSSPEMSKVISLIRRIGTSSVNILITGESGSGKEMVASAIHRVSSRRDKPFIAINCAAIPRDLLESELFGHAKGAFTGATAARRGLFEEAHEGTILLDEIGDLPLQLQAKILRLLQTKQVKPLGQNAVKEVDVRIISATHKNLKNLIKTGEFREDLYYRLNVMPIHLPPLRDRKDDIILLAEYFLKRFHDKGRGPLLGLSRKACAKLQSLPWRGNVRELENVMERAVVLAEGSVITESEIFTEEAEPVRVTTEDLFNSEMSLKDIEREYIKHVLMKTGNRKEAATRILGIDRKTLYRKEKLYGIRAANELN